MIQNYGFSSLEEYDEDGNLIMNQDENNDLVQNTNKLRVKQAQQDMRTKAKAAHEEKVKRDKDALEKDRLRKEAAKRRTMKKEKSRGRG